MAGVTKFDPNMARIEPNNKKSCRMSLEFSWVFICFLWCSYRIFWLSCMLLRSIVCSFFMLSSDLRVRILKPRVRICSCGFPIFPYDVPFLYEIPMSFLYVPTSFFSVRMAFLCVRMIVLASVMLLLFFREMFMYFPASLPYRWIRIFGSGCLINFRCHAQQYARMLIVVTLIVGW